MEKTEMLLGLILGLLLIILGIDGLYDKAYLCSIYIAGLLLVLGILALIFSYYFSKKKKWWIIKEG